MLLLSSWDLQIPAWKAQAAPAVARTPSKLSSGALSLTLSELLNYQSETLCAKLAPH